MTKSKKQLDKEFKEVMDWMTHKPKRKKVDIRIIIIVILLVLIALIEAMSWTRTWKDLDPANATETYAAEQFHLQLTEMAK